jgi:hypothetical protein
MMNDKVVDSSLVILGALQIYSMFLPELSRVADSDMQEIRTGEIHASVAVFGLALVACYVTKNAFPLWVAGLTAATYVGMVEYKVRQGCGCDGT